MRAPIRRCRRIAAADTALQETGIDLGTCFLAVFETGGERQRAARQFQAGIAGEPDMEDLLFDLTLQIARCAQILNCGR